MPTLHSAQSEESIVLRPMPFMWGAVQTVFRLKQKLLKAGAANSARSIVTSTFQEKVMNKDQVKGRIKEAEGKVKETTGKVLGNKQMEEQGKVEKSLGKIQGEHGDIQRDLKKHH
jgi:uncharacterized protein YjbJ (UPF0337 family)